MKSGIELIAIERQEQIEKHRWTPEQDAEYNSEKQLSVAAKRLLAFEPREMGVPMNWDEKIWNKMTSKSYANRLVIAGALIAAELDRLNVLEEHRIAREAWDQAVTPQKGNSKEEQEALDWWHSLPIQCLKDMKDSRVGYFWKYFPKHGVMYHLTTEEVVSIYKKEQENGNLRK